MPKFLASCAAALDTLCRVKNGDGEVADISVTKDALLRLLKQGLNAFSSAIVDTVRPFKSIPGNISVSCGSVNRRFVTLSNKLPASEPSKVVLPQLPMSKVLPVNNLSRQR